MQKRIKSFDKTLINYDICRVSDKFVLLLHGIGSDLNSWKKEKKFLHKKGFSTIAIDLRGHGISGRPILCSDYKLENFAKDIYYIIKKEKIKNFIMVGHSFGGIISVVFHKLYPDLAEGYILIDSTNKTPDSLQKIFKFISPFIHLINSILEHVDSRKKHFYHYKTRKFIDAADNDFKFIYSNIMHTSLKSWLFTFENIISFDGTEILKKLREPLLIVEGEEDSIIPVKIAKKLKKLVKDAKLSIIPKENHLLLINNPAAVEKEILGFASSLKNFIKK